MCNFLSNLIFYLKKVDLHNCVFTQPSDASTSLSRLKNTFSGGLQRKPLRQHPTVCLEWANAATIAPTACSCPTHDMTQGVFWDAYCLNYPAHLQSVVCQQEIVDFYYIVRSKADFETPKRSSLKTGMGPHSLTKENSHHVQHSIAQWNISFLKTRVESPACITLLSFS